MSECERHAEAADQYIRAAQLAPSEYETVFNAANTLRQAGKNSEAERYYRAAAKIRPTVTISLLVFAPSSGFKFNYSTQLGFKLLSSIRNINHYWLFLINLCSPSIHRQLTTINCDYL